MKEVMKYQSLSGGLYDNQELALISDFAFLRESLERKMRFLSVHKEEGQFWDVKLALKAIYEKWQEYREIKDSLPKKRGDVTMGTITEQRLDRPGKTPALKVA